MGVKSSFIFDSYKAYRVLIISTLTFFTSYMVWMMFAVIGVPIAQTLHLTASQFGFLTAMPVLAGSLTRAPLGFLVDRFGSRSVMSLMLLASVIPIGLVSLATTYWQFLILAALMGLVGSAYTVGIAYVAHWFPQNRQGLAMSVYGAGSFGATLNKIIAPLVILVLGWTMVPIIYALLVLTVALLFWLFSYRDPLHTINKKLMFREQLHILRDKDVLRYCQYYAIVFGAFVALSFWMVKYYVNEFDLNLKEAALLAACFTFPGSIFRILGGWLADRYSGHLVTLWVMRVSVICLCFLSLPNMEVMFLGYSIKMGLPPYIFTFFMFIFGVALSFGKASVFKCISDRYLNKMGVVSGIVGTAGGVSGSIWLIAFGILFDLTGLGSSAFMLLLVAVIITLFLLRSSS